MSLDPLCVAAGIIVGPASGLILWTSSRTRCGARAFHTARRLLGGSLLLTLLLAAIATFRWSDATMGATASLPGTPAAGARPPLAGFLVLAALAGIARAVALRRRRSPAASRGVSRHDRAAVAAHGSGNAGSAPGHPASARGPRPSVRPSGEASAGRPQRVQGRETASLCGSAPLRREKVPGPA